MTQDNNLFIPIKNKKSHQRKSPEDIAILRASLD